VINADAGPEVAASLIEGLSKNPSPSFDVGAEVVAERGEGGMRCRAPMLGNPLNPGRIDLHRTNVHGVVGVAADRTQLTALDVEQDHDEGRRQPVGLGRCDDASLHPAFGL
jgi:hypothetical protein